MKPQRWQDRQITLGALVRRSLITGAILILLGLGILYIISAQTTKQDLTGVLAALFVVLGVLFTFIQTIISVRTSSSPTSSTDNSTASTDDQIFKIFYKQVQTETPLKPVRGGVVIYTIQDLLNRPVEIINYQTQKLEKTTSITSYTAQGYENHPIYVARAFLDPGEYTIQCPTATTILSARTTVQISEGNVATVTWRQKHSIPNFV